MRILKDNICIDYDCKVANSFFSKLIGKLFCSNNLLIKNCNAIHTIFLSSPIDVVFLDDKNIIIKISQNVPPRCVILPVKNAVNVIEFNAGFIKSAKINLGDNLVLEE